ncbi:MAG: 50S ribosomal protein L16 [Euryarchaeota archaeon RBG_19FT_COMBO_56_21]|nr:MAG: 50S ribosomal protein L16 [Euryarchaeota archaeon RBG_19FT_COMBO_56_21]
MSRKPGSMYREIKGQAYCRREYMGGVPSSRITQFEHGTKGDYAVRMTLRVTEQCQIRHIALESARISANRYLAKKIPANAYHLKIRVFPHNIIRENKIATGAGADRISDGMRAAFGKPVGTAARVQADQRIMTLETTQANIAHAKLALKRAAIKLPSPCYIEIERGLSAAA